MNLFTKQIEDKYIRQNFEKVEESFNRLVFTLGDFEFFEFKIPSAQEKFKLYHNLGFNPNDVIVTKAIGSNFEFDYNGFNDRYLTIKTTGEVYIRCFIGNMKGSEVVGDSAFASVTDDLGNTGGSGGGTFSFKNRETEIDQYIFSERKVVVASVPMEGSVVVFYNGIPLPSSAYTLEQNIITFEPDLDIHIGDHLFITFTS